MGGYTHTLADGVSTMEFMLCLAKHTPENKGSLDFTTKIQHGNLHTVPRTSTCVARCQCIHTAHCIQVGAEFTQECNNPHDHKHLGNNVQSFRQVGQGAGTCMCCPSLACYDRPTYPPTVVAGQTSATQTCIFHNLTLKTAHHTTHRMQSGR